VNGAAHARLELSCDEERDVRSGDVSRGSEIEFWGDALIRWPPGAVAGMGVAADDASYLSTVGLPVGVDWNLEVVPPSSASDVRRVESMPVLAFDGPFPICVLPEAAGAVVVVEDDGRRVVNSSVRQFGQFLMIYEDYRVRVRALSDGEAEALIDEIEQRMKVSDGEAMRSEEHYWPVVVEQMRQGML